MRADPKIRAVFDCMVFLQGVARKESPASACLLLAELQAIELCVSDSILSEIRDVLTRPRVREKFSALTDVAVDQFLVAIGESAVRITDVPYLFRFDRDPKDEPYINLAIAAGARFLVSRDKDILDLSKSSNMDGERLRGLAPELRILDPVSFLWEIRRESQRHGASEENS